jgi:predicted dehydrogenase
MNSNGLRIGVIGVGFGATVQVPGFQSEGWEVVALCSRRKERVEEAAAKLGIPDTTTDWRELIARSDLDAVSIVTPPAEHHEMALAALRAGKHVLCEKPFALNAQQAKEMRGAAEASGLTAMVTHEFRFAPQRAYVHDLIQQGYVGPLHLLMFDQLIAIPMQPRPMGWSSQASSGGGFLGGLGSHNIDAWRHWFGEITGVGGKLAAFFPDRLNPETGAAVLADAEDTFSFVATFANGGLGTMTLSTAVAVHQGARVLVQGKEGTLSTPQPGFNPRPDGVVLGAKVGEQLQELPMPKEYRALEDDRDERLLPFRLLVREFARGIREGTSPSPSFADGYRCQQVLDAVRESSATGRWVEIAQD